MKKLYTFIIGVFLSVGIFAQTFNGATGAIPDNSTTDFNVSVTGVGTLDCMDITVCINISHNKS